jgi:hypothetical protein
VVADSEHLGDDAQTPDADGRAAHGIYADTVEV